MAGTGAGSKQQQQLGGTPKKPFQHPLAPPPLYTQTSGMLRLMPGQYSDSGMAMKEPSEDLFSNGAADFLGVSRESMWSMWVLAWALLGKGPYCGFCRGPACVCHNKWHRDRGALHPTHLSR